METNVKVVWHDGVKGNGSLKAEVLDTKIAVPTEFGGSGNGASPKEILIASATACYSSVLTSMIESRDLPIVEMTIESKGWISDNELKIIHHPHIVLSNNATKKQIQIAERLFVAADKGCTIGNLLKKADVKIEIIGQISTR
ncbi:OsmC family protein [Priestia endophytica]|uniref:OsmC family protein n=1 Tax=Priestia endophytica TaxID=135735 RepID=UPI0018CFD4EF|nr:OsmC family protein [Priestia endophytica]